MRGVPDLACMVALFLKRHLENPLETTTMQWPDPASHRIVSHRIASRRLASIS